MTMRYSLPGPACDEVCEPVALLAHEWGIPLVSFGCGSSILSIKSHYSTFARTIAPFSTVSPFISAIMNYYQWPRIAIVTSSDHVWQVTANEIEVRHKMRSYWDTLVSSSKNEAPAVCGVEWVFACFRSCRYSTVGCGFVSKYIINKL